MRSEEKAAKRKTKSRAGRRKFFGRLEYENGFDHQEGDANPSEEQHTVLIDAIDADWDGFNDGPFGLLSNMVTDGRPARQYWSARLAGSSATEASLAKAPIVRIELDARNITNLGSIDDEDHAWIEFDISDSYDNRGILYRLGSISQSPFGESEEGIEVGVGPFFVSESSDALNAIFGMTSWPSASEEAIHAALDSASAASQVISFDVGQGGANAFVDTTGTPRLYFDLGMGVRRHSQSSPPDLMFCKCSIPTIILSHWDEDHWAGARADTKMLASTWIVPRQRIGPTHTKFAQAILDAGGSILVFDSSHIAHFLVWDTHWPGAPLPRPSQQLSLEIGTGRTRNDSGIVLRLQDQERSLEWLLTGDASYDKISSLATPSTGSIVVISASHHGANQPRITSVIPIAPTGSNYRRILYSFGEPNYYAHPRENVVRINASRHWEHIAIGQHVLTHGADALATRRGGPAGDRSSIGAGWRQRPYQPRHLLACLLNFSVCY